MPENNLNKINTKSPIEKEREIKQKMLEVYALIEQGNENISVETVNYYQNFEFQGSGLAEKDVLVAKIVNTQENSVTYELYSANTNSLIATVDTQGKLHFMPEYIESLKQIDEKYVEMLELEDLDFVLPQELEKEDIILTKEEREQTIQRQKQKKEIGTSGVEEQEEPENQTETQKEQEQRKQIAQKTKVPEGNILMLKETSNFYKDHPNVEQNLYFRKDESGVIRAEYIDQNGQIQPSKYIEPSNTSLRQETVSLGNDGKPVIKQVPYQVMQTKGLNTADSDIMDIRIAIHFDQYGYLDIEEARQGRNGQWLSHDIEVRGRSNNSHQINEATSIKTRQADPDKQTESYEQAENTQLVQEGVEYDEMYLMEHAEELIDSLVDEGYQREEAIKIFDYMIGAETLSLEEAKERVNEEIAMKTEKQRQEEQDMEEERTPWGDAEKRMARRRG